MQRDIIGVVTEIVFVFNAKKLYFALNLTQKIELILSCTLC